jgi:hypothetical protein
MKYNRLGIHVAYKKYRGDFIIVWKLVPEKKKYCTYRNTTQTSRTMSKAYSDPIKITFNQSIFYRVSNIPSSTRILIKSYLLNDSFVYFNRQDRCLNDVCTWTQLFLLFGTTQTMLTCYRPKSARTRFKFVTQCGSVLRAFSSEIPNTSTTPTSVPQFHG